MKRNGGNNTLPALVSLSFEGYDGETILHRLNLMGIGSSTGAACNGRNTDVSRVLKAMEIKNSLSKSTIRISLGKNNTQDDVEAIGLEIILNGV